MERLSQKPSIAAVALMISFALIVSLWNSDSEVTQSTKLRIAETESASIVRPLQKLAQDQPGKFLKSKDFLPVTTGYTDATGQRKQADANLDDLPKLEFVQKGQRPNKLIPPFQGIEALSGKTIESTSTSTKETGPKIEPKKKNGSASRQPRHAEIAPAIVNTYFQKIKYANSLARRGAVSSAKSELHLALRLLAEAIDQLKNSKTHSKALKEALTALNEIEDFASWGHDISIFVAGHSTEVLRDSDLEKMTVNDARFAYLDHAERNLLLSCQKLSVASEAFRSLGKVYSMADQFAAGQTDMCVAKSMLMFKLATTVNPRDAESANDLAVLYAKYNHMNAAKELLVKSLKVRNQSSTWNNLAKVHQALGEGFLARQATNEARMAGMKNQQTQRILWANPNDFNRVQSMVDPPIMTANHPSFNHNPNSRPQDLRR